MLNSILWSLQHYKEMVSVSFSINVASTVCCKWFELILKELCAVQIMETVEANTALTVCLMTTGRNANTAMQFIVNIATTTWMYAGVRAVKEPTAVMGSVSITMKEDQNVWCIALPHMRMDALVSFASNAEWRNAKIVGVIVAMYAWRRLLHILRRRTIVCWRCCSNESSFFNIT